jgi:hypothetical protein
MGNAEIEGPNGEVTAKHAEYAKGGQESEKV